MSHAVRNFLLILAAACYRRNWRPVCAGIAALSPELCFRRLGPKIDDLVRYAAAARRRCGASPRRRRDDFSDSPWLAVANWFRTDPK